MVAAESMSFLIPIVVTVSSCLVGVICCVSAKLCCKVREVQEIQRPQPYFQQPPQIQRTTVGSEALPTSWAQQQPQIQQPQFYFQQPPQIQQTLQRPVYPYPYPYPPIQRVPNPAPSAPPSRPAADPAQIFVYTD